MVVEVGITSIFGEKTSKTGFDHTSNLRVPIFFFFSQRRVMVTYVSVCFKEQTEKNDRLSTWKYLKKGRLRSLDIITELKNKTQIKLAHWA